MRRLRRFLQKGDDVQRRGFANVVDVRLVGDTDDQDARTFHTLALARSDATTLLTTWSGIAGVDFGRRGR